MAKMKIRIVPTWFFGKFKVQWKENWWDGWKSYGPAHADIKCAQRSARKLKEANRGIKCST